MTFTQRVTLKVILSTLKLDYTTVASAALTMPMKDVPNRHNLTFHQASKVIDHCRSISS